jgi:hypothetical protein
MLGSSGLFGLAQKLFKHITIALRNPHFGRQITVAG